MNDGRQPGQRPDDPRGPGGDPSGDRWGPGGGAGMGGGRSWWWLLIFGLFFLPMLMRLFTGPAAGEVTYNQLREEIGRDNVTAVTISGNRVEGTFDSPVTLPTDDDHQVQQFVVHVPPIGESDIVEMLRDQNIPIYTEPPAEETSPFMVLLNLLPFALMIWIGYRFYKIMQQRGQGMFGVGKSKAKLYDKSSAVETKLDDVAGLESAKEEVAELVDFLRHPKKYASVGARTPKGVLLVGPPGTGKTLLARAVAGEAEAPFYSISGSDFMEMFVGVGASRVRDLFKDAKKSSPSLIFVDELDSIGRRRGAGLGGGHDEREQTLNQLLSELDGFEPQEDVIVLAATNRPDILDPALLRPGRFDRQVTTSLPSLKDRVAILEIHARNRPLSDEVDLEEVARGTPGFSGADLENLLNEASLLAAREAKSEIAMEHVSEARDKVTLGLERKGLGVKDEERKRIACHESGHAIVASVLRHADPLLKVTIVPRGPAMGVTQQLPEEDRHLYSQPFLRDRLSVMLAGRAAEDLLYGDFTNGAENDIREATKLARRMVQSWGMSERLGPFGAAAERQNVFLGEELSQQRDYSEATAREIDQEIMDVLSTAQKHARETLEERREQLEELSQRLLDAEEVSAEEVNEILGAKADA